VNLFAVPHETAVRRSYDRTIESQKVIIHGDFACISHWDRTEKIERAGKVLLEHSSPADEISAEAITRSVKASTQSVKLLKNCDLVARCLGVPDQKHSCGQRCDAATDEVVPRSDPLWIHLFVSIDDLEAFELHTVETTRE
jgi:hypothetical protein